MIIQALRYDTAEPVRIETDRARVHSVTPLDLPDSRQRKLPWVAPGLVDIQVNGRGGQSFSSVDLTPEKVAEILRPHYAFGLTRMCPTLVTASFETLQAGMTAIRRACETERWIDRMAPAIHLEGPYISPEDGPRGAHALEHVRPADWDEFCRLQDAAGGRIRLVTLAPEVPGGLEFIAKAARSGVVVSLGHTAASPEEIDQAVDAGARLSTHLGNGAHGMLHRHPNYIWQQLAADGLSASIICDGHHLPPAVVKTIVRAKTPERVILVSDAASLAGLPPGRYRECEGDVEVLSDGRIVIAGQDQLLAGSTQSIDVCVRLCMEFAGVGLREAVDMANRNPAQLMNLRWGAFQPDDEADFVFFRHDPSAASFEVLATIAEGEVRFGDVSAAEM